MKNHWNIIVVHIVLLSFLAGCAVRISQGFYGTTDSISLQGWKIYPRIEHTSQVVVDTL